MAALPHRPPHRGPPGSGQQPPSLPPRPGGRAMRPLPTAEPSVDSDTDPDDYLEPGTKGNAPEEIYDDCAETEDMRAPPDEVYDDCEDRSPPPLPPLPVSQPEEFYDDFEEQPHKGMTPIMQPFSDEPQETYDDVDNVGSVIVQQLPKVRHLPPVPAPLPPVQGIVEDVYEDPDATQLPPPSSNYPRDDTYEVDFDEQGIPSPPPPPPPPPPSKEQKWSEQNQPPARPKPSSTPAPKPQGTGSFSIGLTQLKDLRAGLRKVSVGAPQDSKPSTSGLKVDKECTPGLSSVRQMFQSKADGKPEKEYCPLASHTNMPVSQPPLPSKPVAKYEPPQAEDYFGECDDIYDDASSGDVFDRFDWYHGHLERKQAEARVKSIGQDGTYLVRVSDKDPSFPYTLVVLNNRHVNNLRIRKRPDGKFALGDEKADELTFTDVTALISHHKNHQVVLLGSSNQSQVVLQHTPPKS